MLPQPSLHTRAARGRAVTRVLSMMALALAVAAGCSERRAAPEAASTPMPADAPTHLQAAHAGAREGTGVATDDHAAHAATGTSSSTLPATPWASDAPLREGMRRMHRAVEALGHAEHEHLDAAQTTAAAQQVKDAAKYMIANCKLPPAPDAALHGVLATLMTGAAALQHEPLDTTPIAAMRDAMALYPRLFVDAEWQADTAPAQ